MENKPEIRRIQANLDGKAGEIFGELASLLPIGDAAVVRTLIIEYGPVKIAELKKKLGVPADANPSDGSSDDNKANALSQ